MSAFCDRLVTAPLPYTHTDLLCCCVPLCSLTHRTLRREENSALSLWGRSHIAPKNAWKTLGALLSPFFHSTRAVALRRRLSLLSNHKLRSPLQEGNFVTWPAVRLRHSEKLRCFYLDAVRTRLEKTSAFHYERAYRASTFEITNLSAQMTRYGSGP